MTWSFKAWVALACAVLASVGPVQAQAPYYSGKTISVVSGAKAGTFFFGAQIVAHRLGKFIPGNPSVVLTPMPGGAFLTATGYVYTAAPADGLTILSANPNVALAQLAKVDQVRFDLQQFTWLGSLGPDGAMFAIRADLPYRTYSELRASGQQIVIGTTGPGSNAHDMPLLLKEFAGMNARLVPGYADNSEILLAVERKEVDGWAALGAGVTLGVNRGVVRAIVRTRATVPGFMDLPVDETLTTDPIGKSLMALRAIPLQIGRAFAVRAGTPSDRVAILRDALAKVAADPETIAEAAKANIVLDFSPHEAVEGAFSEMFSQPPEVLAVMSRYLKPLN